MKCCYCHIEMDSGVPHAASCFGAASAKLLKHVGATFIPLKEEPEQAPTERRLKSVEDGREEEDDRPSTGSIPSEKDPLEFYNTILIILGWSALAALAAFAILRW